MPLTEAREATSTNQEVNAARSRIKAERKRRTRAVTGLDYALITPAMAVVIGGSMFVLGLTLDQIFNRIWDMLRPYAPPRAERTRLAAVRNQSALQQSGAKPGGLAPARDWLPEQDSNLRPSG